MGYVYRHIRLDKNEPFYIGIGSDKFYSRAKVVKTRNRIWKAITAKTKYEIEILFDNLPYEECKKKEKEFIALYGRIDLKTGTLANLTNGGDGNHGTIRSKETRRKISEKMRQNYEYKMGGIAAEITQILFGE